jgi:hypothetical protein
MVPAELSERSRLSSAAALLLPAAAAPALLLPPLASHAANAVSSADLASSSMPFAL